MNETTVQQEAQVTQIHALDMQVCVPSDWTDQQVMDFANANNPAGTVRGWRIRKQGHPRLDGAPERQPCASKAREGFVHIMLEC